MTTFDNFKLTKPLIKAIQDIGFKHPTEIQERSFPVIRSGKDMVGIAQTGTGKTLAYSLPLLVDMKFSDQIPPRMLVLVPTRELVLQMVEHFTSLAKHTSLRILGVYGGTGMQPQKDAIARGVDVLIATPGRLYDLALTHILKLKDIKKLVIDEVDIMLDLGFRHQITNLFELLPEKRQNIMFSATMTKEVDALINDFFVFPVKITVAVSGTPLENINQTCYAVKNYFTKVNLLAYLLSNRNEFNKVLIFMSTKKGVDQMQFRLEEEYGHEIRVLHSNKTQSHRIASLQQFAKGKSRILIASDVMARGIDIDGITHVINFDVPGYPENYMHRIGRTGRAEKQGNAILFFTEKEADDKRKIEKLMKLEITQLDFPQEVDISNQLATEEKVMVVDRKNPHRNLKVEERGPAFHEKKEKNRKTNQGGSYLRKMKTYKKPQTKGDKVFNRKKK